MARQVRNVGASDRARLLQVSKWTRQSFDLVPNRNAVERLLYQLTQSRIEAFHVADLPGLGPR